jgi:hypothetical protein
VSVKYKVKNATDLSVTVVGLAVLLPGEEQEFSSGQADWFRAMNGVALLSTNVPEGIEVTVVTDGES